MAPPPPLTAAISLLLLVVPAFSALTSTHYITNSASKKARGEVKLKINMKYHNGSILSSSDITVHLIWYGKWNETQKCIIRDFIRSISPKNKSVEPSVASWWKTVRLYDDKAGAKVTATICLGDERDVKQYSDPKNFTFTRDTLHSLIKSEIDRNATKPLPRGSVYLLLTSKDVYFDEFCRAICGFHGNLTRGEENVPYAWIGNSATQCPGKCAFPFAKVEVPGVNSTAYPSPNGDVGVDGMVIVVGHELAEMATDPFRDGWYAGKAAFPNEVADLCEGIYGTGGGGSYPGQMLIDNKTNAAYNVKGINEREFLAPWLYHRSLKKCYGPIL